jgi:hypothetical protein
MSEGQTGLVGRDLAESVRIPTAGVMVDGDLVVPAAASGVVLFAHGSGSSRQSKEQDGRGAVPGAGYATLLMDCLPLKRSRSTTEREASVRYPAAGLKAHWCHSLVD